MPIKLHNIPLRDRLISFLVSEDEFQNLQKAVETDDARSLSEYTRSAVFRAAYAPDNDEGLRIQMAAINDRLNEINSKLSLVVGIVGNSTQPRAPTATGVLN